MLKFILQRLLAAIPLLLIISIFAFGLINLTPGDPAVLVAGDRASPAEITATRHELGLDRPLATRYLSFISGALRGDFGRSFRTEQPVGVLVGDKAGISISLILGALVIAVSIALPLGIMAALHPHGTIDRCVNLFTSLALATPGFVVALLLVSAFALSRRWLPATGYVSLHADAGEWVRHLVLPWLSLACLPLAELTRFVRSSMRETLERDYIQTARASGLAPTTIVLKYALKPSAIPVITILGITTGRLIGSAAIVESVFNINGLGELMIESAISHDLFVVQATVLVASILVIAINTLVDLSYYFLDPRLRS